jgi:hypothetical protein
MGAQLKRNALDGPMIPRDIRAEFGEQIYRLLAMGYYVTAAVYDPGSFGNWYVDLASRAEELPDHQGSRTVPRRYRPLVA